MRIPNKYKDRINSFEHDSDGYWISLSRGWRKGDNLQHLLHEDTQQLILAELRRTVPCNCPDCR